MTTEQMKAEITTQDLRKSIALAIKLPRLWKVRLWLTVALIKLAALIAWCDILIEVDEEKKDAH